MVCFVNPDTLEMEDVPKNFLEGYYGLEEEEEEEEEEMLNLKHRKWETCITVEPPESRESFRIMEQFVGQVDDKKLQDKLSNALGNRHPFANFRRLIDNSDYREKWFAFKQSRLEEYVWENLSIDLKS